MGILGGPKTLKLSSNLFKRSVAGNAGNAGNSIEMSTKRK